MKKTLMGIVTGLILVALMSSAFKFGQYSFLIGDIKKHHVWIGRIDNTIKFTFDLPEEDYYKVMAKFQSGAVVKSIDIGWRDKEAV